MGLEAASDRNRLADSLILSDHLIITNHNRATSTINRAVSSVISSHWSVAGSFIGSYRAVITESGRNFFTRAAWGYPWGQKRALAGRGVDPRKNYADFKGMGPRTLPVLR